jgi:hypothetical protein
LNGLEDRHTTLRERLVAVWRGPRSFTAIVPAPEATVAAARERIDGLEPALQKALARVSDLHSLRLCVVPADLAELEDVQLLINVVHDLPLDQHLEDLDREAGELLATALDIPRADLWNRLHAHRVRERTLHLGAEGLRVRDIQSEQRLREEIGLFVDERLASGTWGLQTDPETMRLEIRAHAQGIPDLPRGPRLAKPVEGAFLRVASVVKTFAFPAIGVLGTHISAAVRRIKGPTRRAMARILLGLWWIYGALFTGGALLFMRFLELVEEDVIAPAPNDDVVAELESLEDRRLKNEVTIWFPVKGNFVRRILLRVILWGSERGCRHFWTDGRLANIDSIHFARIMTVGGGRSMLFMTDYDGGLSRYLDEFIGAGSDAVIPISSNLRGCPKTRWLFHHDDPATFGTRWRALVRRYQVVASVWYNAYPGLMVTEVRANANLRDGLFATALPAEEAAAWARSL